MDKLRSRWHTTLHATNVRYCISQAACFQRELNFNSPVSGQARLNARLSHKLVPPQRVHLDVACLLCVHRNHQAF